MHRSYNHLTDNFGLPLPKLIIVAGEAGCGKSCVVELLEQGLRGKTSEYKVFGSRNEAFSVDDVIAALKDADNSVVIVEMHSAVTLGLLIEAAAKNGFFSGVFVSPRWWHPGGAHIVGGLGVEFLRLFPVLPSDVARRLRNDINIRHA